MTVHEVFASQPLAGTITFTAHWNGNTGVSDPFPYDADASVANAAFKQAYERAGMLE